MSPLTADSSAFFGGCDFDFDPVSPEAAYCDTDREFSANFDRQASATNSVSFLGLFPTNACKTVPSLFRSTEERRSPESCSSFRSSEKTHAGFTTVVL
jgi:hypothetical protein